jgi:hypothetical protein
LLSINKIDRKQIIQDFTGVTMKFKLLKIVFALTVCTLVSACGGSSSSSGVILEGQITQGAEETHANNALLNRHGENEPIQDVEVCALGVCALTDSEGQFGMELPEDFEGGELVLSAKGHGIDSQTALHLDSTANDVFVHLQNQDGNLMIHHLMINGEEVEAEQHEDHQ